MIISRDKNMNIIRIRSKLNDEEFVLNLKQPEPVHYRQTLLKLKLTSLEPSTPHKFASPHLNSRSQSHKLNNYPFSVTPTLFGDGPIASIMTISFPSPQTTPVRMGRPLSRSQVGSNTAKSSPRKNNPVIVDRKTVQSNTDRISIIQNLQLEQRNPQNQPMIGSPHFNNMLTIPAKFSSPQTQSKQGLRPRSSLRPRSQIIRPKTTASAVMTRSLSGQIGSRLKKENNTAHADDSRKVIKNSIFQGRRHSHERTKSISTLSSPNINRKLGWSYSRMLSKGVFLNKIQDLQS